MRSRDRNRSRTFKKRKRKMGSLQVQGLKKIITLLVVRSNQELKRKKIKKRWLGK